MFLETSSLNYLKNGCSWNHTLDVPEVCNYTCIDKHLRTGFKFSLCIGNEVMNILHYNFIHLWMDKALQITLLGQRASIFSISKDISK